MFLLKNNRSGQSWWIWAAVLASLVLQSAGQPVLASFNEMSGPVVDMFMQVARILMFGFTGWWLVANTVKFNNRFLAFLGSLAALAVFCGVAAMIEDSSQWVAVLIFAGVSAAMAAMAMHLAGWLCRRRYSPGRFLVCLAISVPLCVATATAPFAAFAILAQGGGGHWHEIISIILITVAFLLANLLPFVALSLANSFYRERLKDLLLLRPAQPPAEVPPALPTFSESARGPV